MGDSPGAGVAPLRSSVVSLTNGPSIMILGRLVSSRPGSPEPDPIRIARENCSMCMIALGIYPGTSCASRRLRTLPGTADVKL